MSKVIKLESIIPYLYVEGNQFIGKYLEVDEETANKLLTYKQVKKIEKTEEIIEETIIETKEENIEESIEAEAENIDLEDLKIGELRELAKEKTIEGYSKLKEDELIEALREVL